MSGEGIRREQGSKAVRLAGDGLAAWAVFGGVNEVFVGDAFSEEDHQITSQTQGLETLFRKHKSRPYRL